MESFYFIFLCKILFYEMRHFKLKIAYKFKMSTDLLIYHIIFIIHILLNFILIHILLNVWSNKHYIRIIA